MLNNFGGSYTLKNIDDEPFLELQMLQICLMASEKAQEKNSKTAVYKSSEFS